MQGHLAHRDGMPRILAEVREQGDLAANPQAIERLNHVLDKEYCTTLRLAHAILQDPGLSAKILRVVNSVAYGVRGEPVSTITRAIVLIGFERVREIATGLLLIEQFTRGHRGNVAVHDNLRRALRCALTAQAISVQVGNVAPEQAYLLGLFSNLGLLWIAAYYPDVLERALAIESAHACSLEEAVSEVAGVTPDRIAAEVLRHWHLPDGYVRHFQRRGSGAQHEHTTDWLSAVAEVADAVTRAVERGVAPDEQLLEQFEDTFGVPAHRLGEAIRAADDELRMQARILGITPSRARLPAILAGALRTTRPGGTSAASSATGAAAGVAAGTTRAAADDVAHEAAHVASDCAHAALGNDAHVAADAPAGGPVAHATSAGKDVVVAPHHADTALAIDVAIEVTGSILLDDDVNHNLTAVVEGVARSGPFDVVVLALATPARDRVLARLCYGPGIEPDVQRLDAPLKHGAGLLAEAVLDAAPKIIASGSAAMLTPPDVAPPRIDVRSFLLQPLVLRGKAIGVIVAARSSAVVTRADLPVVQMFANLACIALRERVRRG